MNNNPYDTSLQWINFHNQQTEDIHQQEATHIYPLTPAYQREKIRPVPTIPVKRLSKIEALERAGYLKGFIMVATLLGFGTLGGLVANQMFSTTPLNQTQTPALQGPSVQAPSQQNPLPSDSSDSGGFFKHHDRGGYGFGQGNDSGNNAGNGSGSNSGAFSGSHTS